MPSMVLLRPEEIPEKFRDTFLYDQQELGSSGNRSVLKISRICSFCSNTYQVVVYNIRADLKRGRAMRAAKCTDCKGRVIASNGYIWILNYEHPRAYDGKYVPEHVLVMEKSLGRYLDTAIESIHHINGDRTDNRIENLQLRNRYHGAGQKWKCGDCGSHNIEPASL